VAFADKILRCRGCGAEFIWTAGEQQFYQLKGLLNEPGRCPECRALRKAERMQATGVASAPLATAETRPRRELHPAICAECGVSTMVPFVPRGDKPVYCSSCFDRIRMTSR